MPEVILPCPACGSSNVYVRGSSNAQVTCRSCGMEGPEFCGPNEVIAAWNALPRALTWTHEPPKVADKMYLAKGMNLIVFLVATVEVNGTLYAQLPDSAENFPLSDFVEWAGPIAPPVE